MEKLFDLTLLETTAMGNKEFMKKMVQMFIDNTPPLLDEMQQLLQNKEWKNLGDVAHKLKPSIDLMGITELKQEIRDIEEWGRNAENLELLPQKVNNLEAVLKKVLDQLKQEEF